MTKNEFRSIIGMRPSDDPRADELRNSNINQADAEPALLEGTEDTEETQNGELMTQEEYEAALADLDDLDAQLDDLEKELDT